MSAKKKDFLSTAMKRTSEWISSQEIPSDVTVHVAGVSFSLHKFPLVSKSGYIRKMISESSDADLTHLDLTNVPGGAEAFELAAKFCYCINFEIGTENIAMLRCVAEYLDMTEEYSIGNLVGRTETYLNDVVFKSLSSSLSVLHSSENLQPVADEVKLVGRCIDTITDIACCKDKEFSPPNKLQPSEVVHGSPLFLGNNLRPVVDWWAEDLTVLKIDVFQRVIIAMIARGFKPYALGPVLMLYAQKSLRGLEFGKARKKIEVKEEHEKRVVLETIVSLLPREKNTLSVSFLSMLLRVAIHLETTVACRLDLEKRMGLQLGQAVLDDLMIPSFSIIGDTLFDVDTVQRIMSNFLEFEMGESRWGGQENDIEFLSPRPNDMEKVVRLMESYIAEIASDRNLQVHKFIDIAELIPEQGKINEDGMYRAIDIYLKAHPALTEMERKKVCGVMDCQKLSREACAHAAQNERLPVQTVVQVLYYEQQRLQEVRNSGDQSPMVHAHVTPLGESSIAEHKELLTLKKENQDMKFELVKMKMRLNEIEKPINRYGGTINSSPSGSSASTTTIRGEKPPLPRKSFMGSVSKQLGKLYTLVNFDGVGRGKSRNKPSRASRHSIS
ncbi:BTB/POZ domain-containing protein SR1IP1-like [Impatiens glandulifera]|uniref:BTB/POZ domain-containing protein SR1IP1-like n=1 Tax=Impatiens glandulifera TaxID=253017 RepID=UPI001FB18BC1|nr:BTB/POZ domain-containing protein SR1IP1-like [Impatiens glandulifera]